MKASPTTEASSDKSAVRVDTAIATAAIGFHTIVEPRFDQQRTAYSGMVGGGAMTHEVSPRCLAQRDTERVASEVSWLVWRAADDGVL